jgi:hypothetical protein
LLVNFTSQFVDYGADNEGHFERRGDAISEKKEEETRTKKERRKKKEERRKKKERKNTERNKKEKTTKEKRRKKQGVLHEVELAVRRHKLYFARFFERVQFDALMTRHVVNCHTLKQNKTHERG